MGGVLRAAVERLHDLTDWGAKPMREVELQRCARVEAQRPGARIISTPGGRKLVAGILISRIGSMVFLFQTVIGFWPGVAALLGLAGAAGGDSVAPAVLGRRGTVPSLQRASLLSPPTALAAAGACT